MNPHRLIIAPQFTVFISATFYRELSSFCSFPFECHDSLRNRGFVTTGPGSVFEKSTLTVRILQCPTGWHDPSSIFPNVPSKTASRTLTVHDKALQSFKQTVHTNAPDYQPRTVFQRAAYERRKLSSGSYYFSVCLLCRLFSRLEITLQSARWKRFTIDCIVNRCKDFHKPRVRDVSLYYSPWYNNQGCVMVELCFRKNKLRLALFIWNGSNMGALALCKLLGSYLTLGRCSRITIILVIQYQIFSLLLSVVTK